MAAIIYIDLFGTDEATAEQNLIHGVDIKATPRNRPSFPGTARVRFPGSLPFNNLPYIRNHYFTGREHLLDDICKGFESGHAISLTQTMTGLGGIGKTQIALEYAFRYAQHYDWIWWVPAESESTVVAAYQDFAIKQKLVNAAQQDTNMIIEAVLTWMDTHNKWLFVYDNLDSLTGSTPWWPRNNRGNVLITTRNIHMPTGKKINITVFTEEDAIDFLKKRTGLCDDIHSAALLAKRLGYLPLALEQAAAYMKDNITYTDYLALLDEHGLAVLDEIDGVCDYTEPVTATWEISFSKINMEAVKQLLYLCAYIAPEGIEPTLFSENAEMLPPPLCDQIANAIAANRLWKELTRYSLLEKQDTSQRYSMHRLLQEVVRNKISTEPQWAQCCLTILSKTYNFEYGNVASHDQFMKLTPHVEALLNSTSPILLDDATQKVIARLYAEGGLGQYYLGNYNQALGWFLKALAICEKVLGKEHPDTATTYNNIAGVYESQGDYPKALEWHKEALAIKEKVLGKEHPSTATTYNNIALVYTRQSDYSKGLEWYQKALTICEKVLGKEHPSTATTYNNIALVYSRQGDYSKALEWYQKALSICEKVLGKEHPDTAATYNNIAGVYTRQGDYPKALEWYQKDLAISEKVLGKEHPDTATTYNNIAGVYGSQGDTPKALEWYQKALAIFEVRLGMNHPYTKTVLKSIRQLSQ